jgi:hypothetical protein
MTVTSFHCVRSDWEFNKFDSSAEVQMDYVSVVMQQECAGGALLYVSGNDSLVYVINKHLYVFDVVICIPMESTGTSPQKLNTGPYQTRFPSA